MNLLSRKTSALVLALCCLFNVSCLQSRPGVLPNSEKREPPQRSGGSIQPTPVTPNPTQIVEDLKDELRRLSERLEELEHKNQQLLATAGKKTSDVEKLETKIAELENSQNALIENLTKKEKELTQSVDIKALLESAKAHIKKDELEDAVTTLTTIVSNQRGKNNEEAFYLRGEVYFKLEEYKKSILDFAHILENHTKSKRTAACLLFTAKNFEALGLKSDAKAFYADLKDRFPKSPEAKKIPKKFLKP